MEKEKTDEKKVAKEAERETDNKGQKRQTDNKKRPGRPLSTDSFRGDHEDLQGHVYTYDSAARANQYDRTTEKISQWAKKELSFPMDVWRAIFELEEPNTDTWKPKLPKDAADEYGKAIFAEEIKEYMLRKRTYNNNKSKMFTVILGQCSEAMKAKLESEDNWKTVYTDHDMVKLLKSIKVWMLNQQGDRNPVVSTYSAVNALFRIRQSRHEELPDYRKRFAAVVDVLAHIGVSLGSSLTKITTGILEKDFKTKKKDATDEQVKKAEAKAFDRLVAVAFINSVDKARFQEVSTNLENEFLKGNDQYPIDLTTAYNMLSNWRTTTVYREAPSADGLSFAQGVVPAGDGSKTTTDGTLSSTKTTRDRSKDTCHACGKLGHHAWEKNKCEKAKEGTTNVMTHEMASESEDDDDKSYGLSFCTSDVESDTYRGELLSQKGRALESVTTNSFNKHRVYVIPKGSIGLDSMSSVDIFGDRRMLRNIRPSANTMRIVCNAGTMTVNQVGNLNGYGTVWYHESAIANILSLNRVQKKFRVTYDSQSGDCFKVHQSNGTIRVFHPTEKGLYASQLLADHGDGDVIMVNTVDENKKSFTKREIRRAEAARRLQITIGRPTDKQLNDILDQNHLYGCDVRSQDVNNARKIFGPDVGSLKGKTVRRKEQHVDLTSVPIPPDIMERHREVQVCFDVMFINGIAFAISISRNIKFCTAEALEDRRDATLLASLQKIKMVYARRGFLVSNVSADNEFHSLEVRLSDLGIALNVVSRDEHVPEVERHIRTLKERCRATYNSVPFTSWPARMLIELVYAMNFWIHAFPASDGVSSTISPRELVTGVRLDAHKHCVLPFGAYVQTHEQHDNTMQTRTIGAIALRPTGNAQGGHFFFSLQTGKRINRNRWTEIPIPADVITRVNSMAGSRAHSRLTFGNRKNEALEELDEEESGGEDSVDGSDTSESVGSDGVDVEFDTDRHDAKEDVVESTSETGVTSDQEGQRLDRTCVEKELSTTLKSGSHSTDESGDSREAEQNEPRQAIACGEHAEQDQPSERIVVDDPGPQDSNGDVDEASPQQVVAGDSEVQLDTGSDAISEGVSLKEQMDNRYGERSGAYGLRPRRKPKYDLAGLMAQVHPDVMAPKFDAITVSGMQLEQGALLGTMLTQFGIKKGLKVFGEQGEQAVKSEMQQLHDRMVMQPISANNLSSNERSDALKYLMFLKKKRDGRVKGRGCADGRKQRKYIPKGDASSPTISIEAVFILVTIAAKERRNVITVDIPGAFMQTDLEGEKIHIKFEGRMAELLATIDPSLYREHVIMENGKSVLYAELRKVLYGMLQASLKFWEQILDDLIGLGFTVNPYDWCVANRIVNGRQQTVGWHVDDFIITHEDENVNIGLVDWLQEKYGKLAPLTVQQGNLHEYLGMTVDFSRNGSVVISMVDYIERFLSESPEDFSGEASTPAAKHLFEVDDSAAKLDTERAVLFHHLVARLVFLCKRARPDVQLAVGFLTTRVKGPDEHDWKKLKRLVQYLRATSELPLTLEADSVHVVKWWVDAAFATHCDMRSQSGGAMSLGKGVVYGASVRQKLNTKSSTEAELVAVDDFMPQVLWTRYFLEAQGYDVQDSVVHQDNQSSILLEKNGKGSSSKRTRHINIRYFFITDRVRSGEVAVKFCPTEDMVADFFTKPLQGARFVKFRNTVLNIAE